MYRRVLLTVDLHDALTWKKALPVAVAQCRAFDAELHLAYVVPEIPEGYVQMYVSKFSDDELLEKARADMRAFAKEHLPEGVSAKLHVEYGSVYRTILRLAKKLEADLLVMASHRPDMADFLLGPNAARVVRHANCSVLVVRD